ncbi:MAG: nitronate monooxygenase [Acidimicrobiales bacterium]|nr:nitronate monooxygenase [Acidimicrobiales bacterium]
MLADTRLRTRVTELFGVEYPIVQTGMGWVSGAELTAATSEAGALGIIAGATLTYPELVDAIAQVKAATSRPFGVNLRTDAPDVDQRVDHMIAAGVRVASFAQAPGEATVKKLKDAGLVVMPTIGAPRHAEKVAEWGVDAVIAQGGEGGGHTGVIPTSLLIPSVVDTVDIPVIAAGGFFDGRGLVAALSWGAEGIAMGTRFLLTSSSDVPDEVKAVYLGTPLTGTVVTRSIDGAPQRVIRTEVVDELEKAGLLAFPRAAINALKFRKISGTSLKDLLTEGWNMKKNSDMPLAQIAMAANSAMLTRASMVEGNLDVGILPTGQNVGVIDELPTSGEVVAAVVAEAIEVLDRLNGPREGND